MPLLDQQRWYELRDDVRAAAPTPCIFLDRDGVVIEEKHYLCDPEQVQLCVGVKDKLAALRQLGLPIVLVTNQSGIGQGMFGWPEYHAVHRRMLALLEMEGVFAAVYANGHTSAEPDAAWRKPNPGMLLQAASDLNIDLAASVMVGDKLVDLQAGEGAGVGRLVHVRTGHGVTERSKVLQHSPHAQLAESLAQIDFDAMFGGQLKAANS